MKRTTQNKLAFRNVIHPIVMQLIPLAGLGCNPNKDDTQEILHRSTDRLWQLATEVDSNGAEITGAKMETKDVTATRTIKTVSGVYSAQLAKLIISVGKLESDFTANATVSLAPSGFRNWLIEVVQAKGRAVLEKTAEAVVA